MPRLAHFSIPADDCERAKAFYREVFGWEFELGWRYEGRKGEGVYWLVTAAGEASSIEGGLTDRHPPLTGITVHFEVDDLDDSVERVRQAGGEVLEARSAIPGRCWFAVCRDTEGNIFLLVSFP